MKYSLFFKIFLYIIHELFWQVYIFDNHLLHIILLLKTKYVIIMIYRTDGFVTHRFLNALKQKESKLIRKLEFSTK